MATLIEFVSDYAAHHSGDRVEMNEQYADLMVRLGLARFVGPEEIQEAGPSEVQAAGPEQASAPGPKERPQAGPAQDLTVIAGIGATRAAELAEVGVRTLMDLMRADAEELAGKVIGVSAQQVRVWQAQARQLDG